jgi:hypothetical protein
LVITIKLLVGISYYLIDCFLVEYFSLQLIPSKKLSSFLSTFFCFNHQMVL